MTGVEKCQWTQGQGENKQDFHGKKEIFKAGSSVALWQRSFAFHGA